jgi:hypothetical protein
MTQPNQETEFASQELIDDYGPDTSPEYRFSHLDDHVVLEAFPAEGGA